MAVSSAIGNIRVMKRFGRALAVATLAAACSSPAAQSPTPSPTPIASTTAALRSQLRSSATPLVRGDVLTMTAQREMVTFFADSGSLIARSTREGLPPYHSAIQRADRSSGAWKTIFEDDASFSSEKVGSGRMAMSEYRAELLSGGGYDVTVVVVDLSTGQKRDVDHFALSSASFHGGGGGPRHAVGGLIALGTNNIAWTHLYELPDGNVESELRVASLSDPSRATVVGRSRDWIEPISIDDKQLLYGVGGTERDELRVRDLATTGERSLAFLRAPTQSAGRDGPVASAVWAGWLDYPPLSGAPDAKPSSPTTTTFRAVNVETGELRERDLGPDYCHSLTANAETFVWQCGAATAKVQAFDPNTWADRTVVVSGGPPVSLVAATGGFIWREAVAGTPLVTLFTPALSSAPAAPRPAPTYVRFAVDKSDLADRPFIVVLFFDGGATDFKVVDPSGQIALRVPIAGSGVFTAESCMVRARPSGTSANATWVVLDSAGFERFTREASTYRVQIESLGGTVTLPLTDSGCRAL
jgi:hypothetical protein